MQQKTKKIPQRMCVTCRTKANKRDLLRIVILPDGSATYDPTGKLQGRGSYLCKNEACIMTELKAHRLARGLHAQIDDDNLRKVAERILDECRREEQGNECESAK